MNDSDTYSSLLQRHRKMIWRLCWKYTRHDTEHCSDLVQEVSLALWQHFGQLRPGATLLEEEAWVYFRTRTVLHNLCRKPSPAHGRRLTDAMAAQLADTRDEDRELVGELLSMLPDEERRLVQLRLDGYNAREIGEQTGLSCDAVYQRIHRTIKKLKQINHAGQEDRTD
jgi:RNA polymerase sigma factor (sigma-70 family)